MSEKTPKQTEQTAAGKGRPTPKRRDREAANRHPLVVNDRKQAREREREARETARAGMMAGDPRYLPERDRGPQKKFVRDLVDSRFTIGELVMPILILFILTALIPNTTITTISTMVLYVFVLVLVVDCVVVAIQVRRRVKARFGADNLERRLGWYAAMRSMQMRAMRIPRPANYRPFAWFRRGGKKHDDGPEA